MKRSRPAKPALCPRCEALRALEQMNALYARSFSPDVNWFAHACGIAEGTFELLIRSPLRLCKKHRNP